MMNDLDGLKSFRRQIGVAISCESLALLARPGAWVCRVESMIPETAEFRRAYFDHERGAFVAVFEDDSFGQIGDPGSLPLYFWSIDTYPCEATVFPEPVAARGVRV